MNNNQTDGRKSRRLEALAATIDEDRENPLPGTKEKGGRKSLNGELNRNFHQSTYCEKFVNLLGKYSEAGNK